MTRYTRDRVRETLHSRSAFEVLVQNPDPASCFGELADRLWEDRRKVCVHLIGRDERPWYRLLAMPGYTMCAQCLPSGYRQFRPLREVCQCCGERRWLPQLSYLELPPEIGHGTALGVLCAPCAAQRPAGLVAVGG